MKTELSQKEQDIDSRRKEFLATEEELNKRNQELLRKEQEMESKSSKFTAAEEDINRRSEELQRKSQEIAAMETEISRLEARIAANESTIGGLESQIEGLEQEVVTKNNTISNLEQEVEDLQAEITRLGQRPQVLGPYFSPNGGCEDKILYWIGRANSTIHILIYSFTTNSIANALVDAFNRGIEVRVVFEEAQTGGVSRDEKLRAAGIAVRTDRNSRNMHNKVMILDGGVVITGSYDWTETAEIFNNENLVVIKSASIGSTYEEEFSYIWGQSRA